MASGIFFPIAALGFSLLTIITFFVKRPFKSTETKIYKYLILTNFIGLILELNCTVAAYINTTFPIISDFMLKAYLLYNLMWTLILTIYVAYISLDRKIFEKYKFELKALIVLIVLLSTYFIYKTECILVIKDNFRVRYTEGPSVNLTYTLCGILIFIIIVLLGLNKQNLKSKKYIPVYIFLVAIVCGIIIQKNIPGLLIMTYVETLTVAIMYHTIENPDTKMLEEIHNAKVISDNANYEKTMFLYDMTNEIRGITKEINSETNDILTETKNEEVNIENINESARNIKSSTGKFTALTNEILDIDRIDSASIKVYNEKYSIKLILKELVSTYKKKCNGKGIDFRTSIVSDLPEYLYGDAIGFKNVLISLLDNSIKYTNKGYIELNVNMIKKQDICRLIITIEDSGVGIKSNDLEKIFKKDTEYFNYNRSNLKNNLYNAKKLITLMGGTIIATSTYGKGTNMKIVLDQKEVIMEKNDYTKVYDKKKILLVDEGEYTEKILRKYLHNTGVEIDSVKLGKNCLDKIRDKERYDLILIDENISPISSIELMHKLKEVRNFNIPCILLTRNYGIEYSCYYVEQGFSDYLFKPIDKNALLNKINKF